MRQGSSRNSAMKYAFMAWHRAVSGQAHLSRAHPHVDRVLRRAAARPQGARRGNALLGMHMRVFYAVWPHVRSTAHSSRTLIGGDPAEVPPNRRAVHAAGLRAMPARHFHVTPGGTSCAAGGSESSRAQLRRVCPPRSTRAARSTCRIHPGAPVAAAWPSR